MCDGPLFVDLKADGLHIANVELCRGRYLFVRGLHGVSVERTGESTVEIDVGESSVEGLHTSNIFLFPRV